jgi:hypothetical protein
MSGVRLVVALSVVAFLAVSAPAAHAERGCQAPPGTAAVDQYCDNLPSVDGTTDPSQRGLHRLVTLLPKPVAQRLREKGLLGEVLLALPAGETVDVHRGGPPSVAARGIRFRPVSDALLPGPAANVRSVVEAASKGGVAPEVGWALGLTLLCLAAVSLWGVLRTG